MKQKIALLFLLVILMTACGGSSNSGSDEPASAPTISTDSSSINVDYQKHSVALSVTASDGWDVSVDQNWCSLSVSGGLKGTTSVVITISANSGTTARTATILVKSGTTRKNITVTQGFQKVDIDPTIVTPAGYTLVWHDDFNDARLTGGKPALPSSEWWYETGNSGWGNNELQNYIAGHSGTDTCAMISDGTLKIKAKKVGSEVYSVRMNTNKSWKYGYFEARMKLPTGKGTWPAFWMMPKNFTAWPDDGEIDIMEEVGYNPNYVSSSIHVKSTDKTLQKFLDGAQTGFHTYACEWTDKYIKTYVDGVLLFTYTNDGTGKDSWPFDAAFYLKLNLAWGGNWGGAKGVDETILPATFEVDYVRVFQKQ
jgi:hypothetical protein